MYCGMRMPPGLGPAPVAGFTLTTNGIAADRHTRRDSPPRMELRLAVDALQAGGAHPRVLRGRRRRGRRRGVAQEALDGGDDGRGLLGRGGRGDDLELRAAVWHTPPQTNPTSARVRAPRRQLGPERDR